MNPLPFYCDARQTAKGHVYGGWVAYPHPEVRWQGHLSLGRLKDHHSTLAEMLVLAAALRAVRIRGAVAAEQALAVYLDNLFVVQALSGVDVRVRPFMGRAFEDAKLAASFFFEVTYTWIPRSRNKIADAISRLSSNQASRLLDTVVMKDSGSWPPMIRAITPCARGTHHFVNGRCACGVVMNQDGRVVVPR